MKINLSEYVTVQFSEEGTLFDRVLKALTYNNMLSNASIEAAKNAVIGQSLADINVEVHRWGVNVTLITLHPKPKRNGQGEIVTCLVQRAKVKLHNDEIVVSRWYHKINLVINETPNGLRYFVSANKKIFWGGLRVEPALKSVGMNNPYTAWHATTLVKNYLEGRYGVDEFYPELQYYRQVWPTVVKIVDTSNPFIVKSLTGKKGAKAILNGIYSPKGEKFLSKSTFGGLGEIRDLTTLVNAMLTVKALRGFGPDFLAKMPYPIKMSGFGDIPEIVRASNDMSKFFAMFGATDKTFAMLVPDSVIGDLTIDSITYYEMRDMLRMFAQIRSRRIRTAVRAHLRGHDLSMGELHDYIRAELTKLEQVNKPIDVPELTAFEGVVNAQITCVVPKWTHDLVQWGAEYNICIGSYGDSVRKGETYCIGFKKPDGSFWGFAEVKKNRELFQLLGKHNSNLPDEPRRAIEDYLRAKRVTIREGYWGAR